MEIVIRMYVETLDEEGARSVASIASDVLGDVAPAREVDVRRYWKVPAYFEVLIRSRIVGETDAGFAEVQRRLGTGWQQLGELDVVWNVADGASFALGAVRWAQVEAIE